MLCFHSDLEIDLFMLNLNYILNNFQTFFSVLTQFPFTQFFFFFFNKI